MPIYEYRCDKGHTFEVMQRMTEEPVSSCETCGQPVQRVFHPVAVHFKGSGFYNTDYGTRKRQRENAAGGGEGSGSSGDSGDSAKKDTKGSSDSGSSGGSSKKDDKSGKSGKSASATKS